MSGESSPTNTGENQANDQSDAEKVLSSMPSFEEHMAEKSLADSGEKQEYTAEQIRQIIENVKGDLGNAESLINQMLSSNASPSVEELQKKAQSMSSLSEQTSTKIDKREDDEESLSLLFDNYQMKMMAMLDDSITTAQGIHQVVRPFLHSKKTLDFLKNNSQLITLYDNIKQELAKN